MTNTTTTRSAASTGVGLLILRIGLGVIFTAHGAQKVFQYTLPGTIESFGGMGVPLPEIAAPVVAFLELIGGVLLVLGVLTRPVALLLALDMLVALFLVHASAGIWVADGGWEFVAVLTAGAAALAFTGAGAYSVDRVFVRSRSGKRAAA